MSAFDLIVFDWDGTLMDSIGTIVACSRRSAEDLGLPSPAEEQVRDLIGLRLDRIAAELFAERTTIDQNAWIERYRHHWIHTFHHRLELLPGARAAVEALAEGTFLAVATGKSRAGLDRDLASTRLGRHFLATRTVDESPPKPSPSMLLEILDELGVRPDRALMIGDTSHDLQMAANAEVAAVAVLTGSHSRPTLERHAPIACLDSVGDLPAWISGR